MVLPTAKGAKSLLMLSYITPRSVLLRQGLSLFVLTGAAGILGILVISWFLTFSLQGMESGSRMNLSQPPHMNCVPLWPSSAPVSLRWKVNFPGKQAIRIKRSH